LNIEHSGTCDGNNEQDSRHIGQLQPRQRYVPVTRRKHPKHRGFEELSGPFEKINIYKMITSVQSRRREGAVATEKCREKMVEKGKKRKMETRGGGLMEKRGGLAALILLVFIYKTQKWLRGHKHLTEN